MTSQKFPPEFLELLESVEAKRPRTVIDHMLRHGQITTEEMYYTIILSVKVTNKLKKLGQRQKLLMTLK